MKFAHSNVESVYFNQCAVCTLRVYHDTSGVYTVKASMMNGELINLYTSKIYLECLEFMKAYVVKLNQKDE